MPGQRGRHPGPRLRRGPRPPAGPPRRAGCGSSGTYARGPSRGSPRLPPEDLAEPGVVAVAPRTPCGFERSCRLSRLITALCEWMKPMPPMFAARAYTSSTPRDATKQASHRPRSRISNSWARVASYSGSRRSTPRTQYPRIDQVARQMVSDEAARARDQHPLHRRLCPRILTNRIAG
jgi:hypothetical protein